MIALSSKAAKLDTAGAIELLNNADPLVAAENYPALIAELYWRRKDLPAVVAISTTGIDQLLSAAKKASGADVEMLQSTAKQLAFNLASFTWPGLARQLKRSDKVVATALWAVDAHKLAAGNISRPSKSSNRRTCSPRRPVSRRCSTCSRLTS